MSENTTPPLAPTPSTPTDTTSNTDSGSHQQQGGSSGRGDRGGRGNGRGGRGNRGRGGLRNIEVTDSNFQGSKSEVGIVMGLPTETNLKHSGTFEEVQDKFDEYVIKEYKKGINLKPLIKDLKDPKGTLKKPDDCDKPDDKVKMKKWERELDAYDNKVEQVEENIQKLYSLLWG